MPIPIAVGTTIWQGAGALGGVLFGKRKRSSCREITGSDIDGFRKGTVAPYVLDDRVQDIHEALGVYPVPGFGTGAPKAGTLGLSVAQLAELHMASFVPLCQSIEGDNYTDDPQSGTGLAMYNRAREAWRAQIREGKIVFHQGGARDDEMPVIGPGVGLDPVSLGRTGGSYTVNPGGGTGAKSVNLAGFSGGTALLLGLGALLLLGGRKR